MNDTATRSLIEILERIAIALEEQNRFILNVREELSNISINLQRKDNWQKDLEPKW